jgi:hypothetical protein
LNSPLIVKMSQIPAESKPNANSSELISIEVTSL